jgi:hypothetical protein
MEKQLTPVDKLFIKLLNDVPKDIITLEKLYTESKNNELCEITYAVQHGHDLQKTDSSYKHCGTEYYYETFKNKYDICK